MIATKHLYEIGSAESRQPSRYFRSRLLESVGDHSLTIFLSLTAAGWVIVFAKMHSEGKWGQVSKHRVRVDAALRAYSYKKKLIEDTSKESH